MRTRQRINPYLLKKEAKTSTLRCGSSYQQTGIHWYHVNEKELLGVWDVGVHEADDDHSPRTPTQGHILNKCINPFIIPNKTNLINQIAAANLISRACATFLLIIAHQVITRATFTHTHARTHIHHMCIVHVCGWYMQGMCIVCKTSQNVHVGVIIQYEVHLDQIHIPAVTKDAPDISSSM